KHALADGIAHGAVSVDDHRCAAEEIERRLVARALHVPTLCHLSHQVEDDPAIGARTPGRANRLDAGWIHCITFEARIVGTRETELAEGFLIGDELAEFSGLAQQLLLSSRAPGIALEGELGEIETRHSRKRTLRGVPAEGVYGQESDVGGIDVPSPEG